MTSAPQIRLRTVFLLFFCAAVGLTISNNPLGAIQPTIEIAIVIGLLQQAWQLFIWRTSECNLIEELSFARRFAIFWRIAVAMILGACVIWRLLVAKKFVTSLELDRFLISNPIDEGLPQLCVLIALCNSLTRWRPARSVASFRAIRAPVLWGLGIAIALITLIQGTTLEFLVHYGLRSIESRQKFRRTGLYVPLGAEGYDALWFGLGAVVCLLAAIALVSHLRRRHSWPRVRRYRWLIFLLLMTPSAAFCVWYYCYEFYRLSPDIGGAGLALNIFDVLAGAVLAALIVTAGAYQVAAKSAPLATICADLSEDLDRKAFHESFLVLFLLVLSALVGLFSLLSTILMHEPFLSGISLGRPMLLLAVATLVVTVQLCWVRWKTRSQPVPWILHPLSPQLFGEGWILLALLVICGIPTIRAFAFLLWLGPFNLGNFFFGF